MKTLESFIGKRVMILGPRHAWEGHVGRAMHMETTPVGPVLVVELDGGQRVGVFGVGDIREVS